MLHVAVRVCPQPLVVGQLADQLAAEYAQRGVITVSEDSRLVYCPEPSLTSILSFEVDAAYNEASATTTLFHGSVLPLVTQVMRGGNAMVVVAGEDAVGKSMTAEGRPGQLLPGLVSLAAEFLLTNTQGTSAVAAEAAGADFYTAIRVSWYAIDGDRIVDLLSVASKMAPTDSESTLKMKDDPQQGIVIPDLWEVEVRNPADVAELVRSVRAECAFSPAEHTVFTLSMQRVNIKTFGSTKKRPGKTGTDTVPPARLSIVTVANFVNNDRSVPEWATHVSKVIEGLATSSLSLSFHKQRISFLLRDALVGRIPAAWIALVSPTIDAVAASGATLKLASRVRAVRIRGVDTSSLDRTPASPSAAGSASPAPKPPTNSITQRLVAAVSPSSDARLTGAKSRRDLLQDPATKINELTAGPASVSSAGGSAATSVAAASLKPVEGVRPTRLAKGAASGGAGAAAGSRAQAPPSQEAPSGTLAAVAAQVEREWGQDSLSRAESMAAAMAQRSAEGDESAKWFTAMMSALEVSRDENRALREQLAACHHRLENASLAHAETRQTLVATQGEIIAAKEAGKHPMDQQLIKELRTQLKNSQREVKDYELYKDVMEAAVVKMKEEMEQLVAARDALQKELSKQQQAHRRDREALTQTKRRLAQLDAEVVKTNMSADDKNARLRQQLQDKERELMAYRHEAAQDQERLIRELHAAREESSHHRRQVDQLSKEVESLKAAHTHASRWEAELLELRNKLSMAEAANDALREQLAVGYGYGHEALVQSSPPPPMPPSPPPQPPVPAGSPQSGNVSQPPGPATTPATVRRGVSAPRTAGAAGAKSAPRTSAAASRGSTAPPPPPPAVPAHKHVTATPAAAPRTMPPPLPLQEPESDDEDTASPVARPRQPIAKVGPHHQALVAGLKREMAAMKRVEIPTRTVLGGRK